jgi:glyceraldehyde-3-phosphate dehydrogenase/erythrose-4-phosphate dehydrogenase
MVMIIIVKTGKMETVNEVHKKAKKNKKYMKYEGTYSTCEKNIVSTSIQKVTKCSQIGHSVYTIPRYTLIIK